MNRSYTWKDTAGCIAVLLAILLTALTGVLGSIDEPARVAAVTFSNIA